MRSWIDDKYWYYVNKWTEEIGEPDFSSENIKSYLVDYINWALITKGNVHPLNETELKSIKEKAKFYLEDFISDMPFPKPTDTDNTKYLFMEDLIGYSLASDNLRNK